MPSLPKTANQRSQHTVRIWPDCLRKAVKAGNVPMEALEEFTDWKKANPEPAYSTDDATPRYIVAENYMLASSEDQANAIALEIAKNIEIDTPVVVFSAHKARELRINWRDA